MIADIVAATHRPAPFQPSEAPFWDDPYISRHLLSAHLDPTVDAASRPPQTIAATVQNLVQHGLVRLGTRVLDLGCGPGLYAEALARAGCQVTGVDLSTSSVAWATKSAAEAGLDVDYRVQDFRTLDEAPEYDLVLQAYGELSTFPPDVRSDLLRRMRQALAPGGAVVVDVSTPAAHADGGSRTWEAGPAGFWRPGPHVVLEERFRYDGDVCCDQYVVADEGGVVTYRMWFQDLTPERLTAELDASGLVVEHVWGSLTGEPMSPESPFIAVVARAV